ncbi:hypothetical protein [Pseudarthrobacter sp. S9]|uniref:hypothetical protein n=1 Tax=Pseudarthrobacter sp. S9 TaxID=3418421 RepID=UPI003CFED423
MPWWSWIVIWIALVALSLLFFVMLGIRLFRQFMTTLKELGEAGERFTHLPSRPHTSDPDTGSTGTGATAGPRPEPGAAVFASPARVRHDYHSSKKSRQDDRRLRRIQRKKDRGQPQALRDIEFR